MLNVRTLKNHSLEQKITLLGIAFCLGFNVMPRQHELAARASRSSQHAPTRALSTSSQHEHARARSTSQLEPSQHELAARASSSSATSELEHGTRLAPLFARHAPLSAPLPHHRTADGALAAWSGSSVQFTRDGRESSNHHVRPEARRRF